jgi:sporulation protein YlmC with PRC-barrel domain
LVVESEETMRISLEQDLRGRTVIDGEGRAVGAVDDVMVDGRSWRIEAFRVKLRRELAAQIGVERSAFRPAFLDIPVEMVHAAGDAVILNVPMSALHELQTAEAASPGP